MTRRRSSRSRSATVLLCLAALLPASSASIAAPGGNAAPAVSNYVTSSLASIPSNTDEAKRAPTIDDARVRQAANRFGVAYDALRRGLDGVDMLYARQYGPARDLFRELEKDHPTQAIGPFGLVLLAQAQMAENLDFRQERTHKRALEETVRRADAALARGEAPVFNYFLRAGARGMNGIHLYRRDEVVTAFQEGWSALQDLERAHALDPGFADPNLGFGVYNYWRTALTRKYWYLPGFPDKRKEGIKQLELARDKGIFTPTLARLALAFTYLEDGRADRALRTVEELQARHPSNVITPQLAGQLQARMHRYDMARASYERVLAIDPRNVQSYFYLGSLELNRGRDLVKARDYLAHFVGGNPENAYETIGRIRLGDAHWLLGDRKKAIQCWEAAAKQDPDHRIAKLRVKGSRPKARAGLIGLASDVSDSR